MYHWDGAKFRVDHLPSKTRLYPVRAGDRLYVFTRETGLYELGPKGPELKLPASEFKRGAVLWMEPLAPGSRIVTGAALYVYQHGKLEEPNPQVGDLLAKLSIATATSLPDGWMCEDEPAADPCHLARNVIALPFDQAISLQAFLMIEWRSAMVSASA